MSEEPLVVYSDYVCPFCYLGRRSLALARERYGLEAKLDWQPFDLRAGRRSRDGTLEDSATGSPSERARENVARLRERYGAEEMVDLDDLPETDSFDAQLLSSYVEREHPGRWLAFDEALFSALWEEGRDIGLENVLVDIGTETGIEESEIRLALGDEDLETELEAAFEQPRTADITGVPTFVYRERIARGAVPPEQFARLLE